MHAVSQPVMKLDSKATGTNVLMMVILLLQARALLLRSGDIEKNPGPGLYPGEMHYTEY